MTLLTTLPVDASFASAFRVVEVYHALADGIRRAFARHGAGRIDVAAAPDRDVGALVQFLPGFEDLAGG